MLDGFDRDWLNIKERKPDLTFPVGVGGMTVFPGDVIVADGDGLIVAPRARALEVGKPAREIRLGGEQSRAKLHEKLQIPSDRTVKNK